MKHLRLGELFSGPGGLSYGAILATKRFGAKYGLSIKPVWAVDRDASSCETYRENIHPASDGGGSSSSDSVLNADVNKPSLFDELSEISGIDILAFGFPCNDFSLVGERLGLKGDYGPLYRAGIRALKRFKPEVFIAENVSGLRSANEGRAWKEILLQMQNAGEHGYELTPHKYEFERYGVPQRRHRWVIVGVRKDSNGKAPWRFLPPAPDKKKKLVKDAFKRVIPPDTNGHVFVRQHPRVVERLKHIQPGENAWNADIPKELRLNVKGATLSQIYRRLKFDEPAYTVTGSGGGGTHVYHWKLNRALTNRERARLQSFPDAYTFHGTSEQIRRQIGMAVPPEGAARIFRAILQRRADPDSTLGLLKVEPFDATTL